MNIYTVNNSLMCAQSRARNGMLTTALRLLVACLALQIYTALFMDWITNAHGLVAYTLLLLGHLFAETRILWAHEKQLFWINPVVLASIFTFVMAFGVTNILYFMPTEVVDLVGLEPISTPWMNQLMLLVVMGAISMWVGYSSSVGRGAGRMLHQSRFLRKWMSPSLRIHKPALYACLAISLIAKLWSIKLGVFGYSSTYDRLIEAANYTQYFAMADSLGKLALVGVALQCFSSSRYFVSDWSLLCLVLAYEIAFGLLSGFKSAVVMPFIIVGLVYYSQHNRFPRWLIPAVVVGCIVAYAVIEPFRAARNESAGFVDTNLGGIVSTIIRGGSANMNDDGDGASTALSIVARSNMTYIASLGIEYAANHNELPAGSPAFLADIFLAPAHALTPRFLWESKSLQNIGLWYTQEVMELDHFSSTGMSPITYLNFAGGPFAVILGFLMVGIFQRGLFDGFRHFGGGGLIVLFGLLGKLAIIDNAFNSFFISIIRFLPILVVVQYVMLRRPHR
jgi:hypothetical protein